MGRKPPHINLISSLLCNFASFNSIQVSWNTVDLPEYLFAFCVVLNICIEFYEEAQCALEKL